MTAPPRARRLRQLLTGLAVLAWPFALFLAVAFDGRGDLRYAVPVAAVALPAVLLRRWPLAALTLMLTAAVVIALAVFTWETGYLQDIRYLHLLALDVAVGVIATEWNRARAVAAGALALVVEVALVFLRPLNPLATPGMLLTVALGVLAAVTIGALVRERREQAAQLREQATARAVGDERLRIARELHDQVAHSIGIIAIQAGVGGRVIDTQPGEARQALTAIEATSRETLAGLRRTLVALRRADAPAEPAAGLSDVERLATSVTAAGVRVEVRWAGRRRPLPPEVELSAYRIVQEALTNVVRHAGTDRCAVVVDYGEDRLGIEVLDEGRGCAVAGIGYGIVGMRERVGLLGGDFTAEPRPGGGFRVAASLPVEP